MHDYAIKLKYKASHRIQFALKRDLDSYFEELKQDRGVIPADVDALAQLGSQLLGKS